MAAVAAPVRYMNDAVANSEVVKNSPWEAPIPANPF